MSVIIKEQKHNFSPGNLIWLAINLNKEKISALFTLKCKLSLRGCNNSALSSSPGPYIVKDIFRKKLFILENLKQYQNGII